MSWVKLDDQFFTHPKVIDLPKDAKLLYLSALTYSAGQLTDGIVSPGALRVIAATVDVSKDESAALVAAGLWETCEFGWIIHDYHDYNLSAGEAKEHKSDISQKRSEAGRKGMASRYANKNQDAGNKNQDADNNADNEEITILQQNANKTDNKNLTPSPSPSPSRIPIPPESVRAPQAAPLAAAHSQAAGKRQKIPLPRGEDEVRECFAGHGRPELTSAFWDYWESAGWKRQGQLMADWRAAVRTWIARQDEQGPLRSGSPVRGSPPRLSADEQQAVLLRQVSEITGNTEIRGETV